MSQKLKIQKDKNHYEYREERQKWVSYLPSKLFYKYGPRPIFEYLSIYAKEYPDRPGLIFYGTNITYKQWDDYSNCVAQFLKSFGIKKGDRVAIFLPTFPGFAIVYMGVLKIGAIVVPCSPAFKEAELEYQIKDSSPRVLFCLDEYMHVVMPVLKKFEIEMVITMGYRDFLNPENWDGVPAEIMKERVFFPSTFELKDIFNKFPPHSPEIFIDIQNDIALIIYTGGTTGLPKGAIHTYETQLYKTASRAQINFYNFFKENMPNYVIQATPIYHISGMLQFNTYLYQGLSIIMFPHFHAIDVLKAIHRYKPEYIFTSTPMNVAMMNNPEINNFTLRSIRRNMIASLGMQLTEEIAAQWGKYIAREAQIAEHSYGLTETHTGDTFMPLDRPVKWGSVGIPAYGEKIKIVSLENKKKVLTKGEVGEIAVFSPSNFKGYWRRPKETSETLIDGWVYTGDIGRFDADGYLYFLGRRKEMIKVSGYSVFPEEVELLMRKHPAVDNCGVKGIPDSRRGEVVKAAVVLKKEFKGKITPAELIQWAEKNMSYYKVPKIIEIRESLPITGTGKILRRLL